MTIYLRTLAHLLTLTARHTTATAPPESDNTVVVDI